MEGLIPEAPLEWDQLSGLYLEDYTSVWESPIYTPDGYRVMLTIEDTCSHAGVQAGIYKDCGSYKYFRQKPDSQLGVCHCEALRRKVPNDERNG